MNTGEPVVEKFVDFWSGNKPFDFGGDTVHDPDPGFLIGIF